MQKDSRQLPPAGERRQLWGLVVGALLSLALAPLLVPWPQPGDIPDEAALRAPELEHLSNEYRRLVHLGYGPADFRTALQEVLPALPGKQRLPSAAPFFVKAYVKLAMAQFRSSLLLPCGWDSTLQPPPPGAAPRLYIASNQYNSAAVMPNLITQLLRLAVAMPPGSVFVSVYESGSTDTTPQWLELLALLLRALDVPASIVTNGTLRRADDDDRIGFLAAVRNAALDPLETLQAKAAQHAAATARRSRWAAAIGRPLPGEGPRGGGGGGGPAPPGPGAPFLPDRLVFINDVFFCAADVVRLLAHNADLMCGLDTWRVLGARPWVQRILSLPLEFYDYWVARDVTGRRLHRYPPYVKQSTSAERLRAGLPFPVACCWNGLAVLRAAPFLGGLRFRNRTSADECDASECSLVCEDLHRLGYGDVAVDPGVRVAYDLGLAQDLLSGFTQQSQVLPWSHVAAAPHRSALGLPRVTAVECCSKQGAWDVRFDNCRMVDIFARNFTALALAAARRRHGNQ